MKTPSRLKSRALACFAYLSLLGSVGCLGHVYQRHEISEFPVGRPSTKLTPIPATKALQIKLLPSETTLSLLLNQTQRCKHTTLQAYQGTDTIHQSFNPESKQPTATLWTKPWTWWLMGWGAMGLGVLAVVSPPDPAKGITKQEQIYTGLVIFGVGGLAVVASTIALFRTRTLEQDLGTSTREKDPEEVDCRPQLLADTPATLHFSDGSVLETVTDHRGQAHFKLTSVNPAALTPNQAMWVSAVRLRANLALPRRMHDFLVRKLLADPNSALARDRKRHARERCVAHLQEARANAETTLSQHVPELFARAKEDCEEGWLATDAAFAAEVLAQRQAQEEVQAKRAVAQACTQRLDETLQALGDVNQGNALDALESESLASAQEPQEQTLVASFKQQLADCEQQGLESKLLGLYQDNLNQSIQALNEALCTEALKRTEAAFVEGPPGTPEEGKLAAARLKILAHRCSPKLLPRSRLQAYRQNIKKAAPALAIFQAVVDLKFAKAYGRLSTLPKGLRDPLIKDFRTRNELESSVASGLDLGLKSLHRKGKEVRRARRLICFGRRLWISIWGVAEWQAIVKALVAGVPAAQQQAMRRRLQTTPCR